MSDETITISKYTSLKERYPDIPREVLRSYKEPDEYCVLNDNDPSLHPVWIKLPEAPPWHEIDGFGLPAHEQKFRYQEMPKKLQKLINNCSTIDQIWNTLQEEQFEYHKEIEWIKKQWDLWSTGYWFFCNGKPTWIVWWHYIYLNFWHFKNKKKPEYRDKNRKFYIGMYYAYTTTKTVEYDNNGRLVYEDTERKILKMRDTGLRTMMGIAHPKERKEGASNMCLCAEYCETITHNGVIGGIISMTGEHAQTKMFDDIMVAGWNQMPFFMKPRTTSNQNPSSEITFNASRQRADKLSKEDLGSTISYSTTSTSQLYDGGNNIWINCDESGKTNETDVFLRHKQLKPCVSLGNGANIFGFLTYPSTVGQMSGLAAPQFFKICQDSHFEKRDISGQTTSGMMIIYFPATEGLDGFIDQYGASVVDTPTPEQAKFIGKSYGSKEFLNNKREKLLADGDLDGYNEEVRLFPMRYMECFRTEDGEIGFNSKIINDRLDDLVITHRDYVRKGNFKRMHGDKNGIVYWEDDEDGRWWLSKILNPDETNRFITRKVNGELQRFPIDPKYTSCADTFTYKTKKGNEGSLGGGATFWDFDPLLDSNKDIKEWQSYRFVCTYLNRPTQEEYLEDMLMQDEYFGAMQYPENNHKDIWRYYEQRGRMGYLKYGIDIKTGNSNSTPGFNSLTSSKQDLFKGLGTYIEDHGHREVHKDLFEQWKDIKYVDQMTHFDLVTSSGGCLLGTPPIIQITRNDPKNNEEKKTVLYPKKRY